MEFDAFDALRSMDLMALIGPHWPSLALNSLVKRSENHVKTNVKCQDTNQWQEARL